MENNSEKETLPNLQTVLDAVNNLRSEMNARFDKVEVRLTTVENDLNQLKAELNQVKVDLNQVKVDLNQVKVDLNQVKEMQFVFENEFDRLLALSYKALELSHENRADVRIMRKEISAWSHDVRVLERKVA